MRRQLTFISIALLILAVFSFAEGPAKSSPDSFSIVFKDGHQKNFSTAEVSRLEFKNGALVIMENGREQSFGLAEVERIDFNSNSMGHPGRNHFIGKWEVGIGASAGKFFITLEADGQASKTIGSKHGTWEVVNGEARISWDDGWHDIIRKVGEKHEKLAFEPGKSLDDQPSNVTEAHSMNAQPI